MKAGSNGEACGLAGVAPKATPASAKPDVLPAAPRVVPDDRKLRELTRAIRRGDEAAFTEFYDRYSLRLYQYLLVLAKGDEAKAREILQTMMVKLTKRFEVFEQESRLWAWLRAVARNSFVDHWRVQQREGRFVPLDDQTVDETAATLVEPQLVARLRQALEALPPVDSELVLSVYVEGRSLGELADERGETYKAVQCRLARLRQKLKANLLNLLRYENIP